MVGGASNFKNLRKNHMNIDYSMVFAAVFGFIHGCVGLPLIFIFMHPLIELQSKLWSKELPVTRNINTIMTLLFLLIMWGAVGWLWIDLLQVTDDLHGAKIRKLFALCIPIGLVFYLLVPSLETSIRRKIERTKHRR
jgi:heme/copper-type cytochrome/quinol oxidase subunit 2